MPISISLGVLGFPGITVGVEGVSLFPSRKRKKKTDPAGPFLIIARDCGLALDTGQAVEPRSKPILLPPHADLHQLWYLHPSGVQGELLIISAANKLALDSTTDSDQAELVMWETNKEPWQRWQLHKTPDGAAFEIQAVHGRRFLTAAADFQSGWNPWFGDRFFKRSQQWIFGLPHGGDPTGT
ncbi:RICIN domain-containing protein [Streptomyces sp. NPDC049040]|uniref:RICIN domain-containing protein n=1 Tax=Streptomyces sp. NPDC049040 TaxID=3365593 RepID=UPI0037175DB6